jgi:hypothetical protein
LTRQEAWFNSNLNLDVIYEALGEDDKQNLAGLHHFEAEDEEYPAEQDSLLGRFRTNSLPIADTTDGFKRHGLFPMISRINSDCRPNAHYRYCEAQLHGCIYAVRDIATGEELTICYVDQLLNKAERQDLMKKNFGFVCDCPTCSKTDQALKSDDSLREMVHRLDLEAENLLQDGLYEFAEQVLSLRLEGLEILGLDNDPCHGFRTVYCIFSFAQDI